MQALAMEVHTSEAARSYFEPHHDLTPSLALVSACQPYATVVSEAYSDVYNCLNFAPTANVNVVGVNSEDGGNVLPAGSDQERANALSSAASTSVTSATSSSSTPSLLTSTSTSLSSLALPTSQRSEVLASVVVNPNEELSSIVQQQDYRLAILGAPSTKSSMNVNCGSLTSQMAQTAANYSQRSSPVVLVNADNSSWQSQILNPGINNANLIHNQNNNIINASNIIDMNRAITAVPGYPQHHHHHHLSNNNSNNNDSNNNNNNHNNHNNNKSSNNRHQHNYHQDGGRSLNTAGHCNTTNHNKNNNNNSNHNYSHQNNSHHHSHHHNHKPKRRRVQTQAQRKAANVRERRRMFHLNEAFDELRKRLPAFNYEKRLSRIETLRLAMTYIGFMREITSGKDPCNVELQKHANLTILSSSPSSSPTSARCDMDDDDDDDDEDEDDDNDEVDDVDDGVVVVVGSGGGGVGGADGVVDDDDDEKMT